MRLRKPLKSFLSSFATMQGAFEIFHLFAVDAIVQHPRRYDSTDILNKLRAEHHKGGKWFGVDVENEGICDTYESFVWEPLLVKRNAISAATEAACLILSVDETVMNPNSEQAKAKANPMNKGALAGLARGRGRGRGRR
jgi:T-complex protein 1 subunit eta